jgi:hypothetical protein
MVRSIIVIVVFLLAQINSWLASQGKQPLPSVNEDQVAWFFTFVISVWTMVRENPLKKLKRAPKADK